MPTPLGPLETHTGTLNSLVPIPDFLQTLNPTAAMQRSADASLSSMFFPGFSADSTLSSTAAAANGHRQPAPPPQLPLLQFQGRHQDPVSGSSSKTGPIGSLNCPHQRRWLARGKHRDERLSKMSDEQIDQMVDDVASIVRREFDCWIEVCWSQAFHQILTTTLPTLLLTIIISGVSPTTLRRQIVRGGPTIEHIIMCDMLEMLQREFARRVSGKFVSPGATFRTESSGLAMAAAGIGAGGFGAQPSSVSLPRDGVCTHDLGPDHGFPDNDDDHAACMCQLSSCLDCLHKAARRRKCPIGLLPFELIGTPAQRGWSGRVETEAQYKARLEGRFVANAQTPAAPAYQPIHIPQNQGFVQVPRSSQSKPPLGPNAALTVGNVQSSSPSTIVATDAKATAAVDAHGNGISPARDMSPYKPSALSSMTSSPRRPPVILHPQMTDMLAVEEHIKWRLKELGAVDPALESRYGSSTNAPNALSGLEHVLRLARGEAADEENTDSLTVKMAMARSKSRPNKVVMHPAKKEKPLIRSYLPKEWAEAAPSVRNTAVILSFRHFVHLLHRTADSVSPFSYPEYAEDIAALERAHPVAMYRRLTEATATAQKAGRLRSEGLMWSDCMDKWTEELGAREKTVGNALISRKESAKAISCYTRAISLDGKKTVYYTNRAVAYNSLNEHQKAEEDSKFIIKRDSKNSKAFFQRGVARIGLKRWREAEADLLMCLKLNPNASQADTLIKTVVRPEVAKLPKLRREDVLDF